jgi:NAD(P)-dependent dehydrogenase (short-subunit alcohol dehydrogenase family)
VEEDVVGLFGTTADAFGPLHGAVVNAGIAAPPLPLVETDIARLRRIVDVNVMGALLCAREAARRLAVSLGGGSVVLVSSAASRLGSPHEYVDYAASKGAVDSLALGSRASSPPTACASTPYARASSRRTSTRAPGSPTVPSSSPR